MHSDFSKYDVYADIGSLYYYKESHVLCNKYGIKNYKALRELEQDIVGAKQSYLLDNPIRGRFTSNHICNIHRFLFEDIYSFAGRFRLETIRKGETIFENEKSISSKLSKLLAQLKRENHLADLSYETFIEKVAYYFAELNYIHPFREGNGRSTREFIRLLVDKNGYVVKWSAVGVDVLIDAIVESVYDTSSLVATLMICISKLEK